MRKQIILVVAMLITIVSCKKGVQMEQPHTSALTINGKNVEYVKRNGSAASIVFVSGFGGEIQTWSRLYNLLPSNYSYFVYNRPGIGKSENVAGKRDAATIVAEMRQVLEAAKVAAPYILVGHSMGGLYARMFYHQNQGKVKGMVLVDASHERQVDSLFSFLPPPDRDAEMINFNNAIQAALAQFPEGSVKEEFRSNYPENFNQMKQYPPITDFPVEVIASMKLGDGDTEFTKQIQKALHKQWADDAGAKGRFITTNKSGHNIHIEEPSLVLEGIKRVANY